MVLKGKFSSYNEFFDLIKLITSMSMTVTIKLTNKRNEFFSIAFENGVLSGVELNSESVLLLNFNFDNGKVENNDFVESLLFYFLTVFEGVTFETVFEECKYSVSVSNFETLFLDTIKEIDEVEDFTVVEKVEVDKSLLGSVESEQEIKLLGYLLIGYTVKQSLFSCGKPKEFIKAFASLYKKGVLK